ncbi:MAG: hypothetical protein JWM51_1175 [Microbacteriaceae bacterium]|nr:hypothetical protein [Microbacteriaceae bacterium]
MRALIRNHPLASLVVALVTVAVVVGVVWATVSVMSRPAGEPVATPGGEQTPAPTGEPSGSPAPSAPGDCAAATISVATAEELASALDEAAPGDTISLAPGTYQDRFVAKTSGTPQAPITLCGTAASVLDGGGIRKGYVLHLDGAQYWNLVGFAVTNGQKGVMADGTVGSVIRNLTVYGIGDEAIHLRRSSTDNSVLGNTIRDTGLRKEKFGEGVYVGTAESNWCDVSDCKPDPSDRNLIEGNTISSTTSESVDLKEGTSDGIVRGNHFDGSSITGADSWVDVKGNGYLIEGNTGVNTPGDGYQTHEILDGWGTGNVFRDNTAEVNGPGFGYALTPERGNVVECNNTASGAGEGDMNVNCSR